MQKLDKSAQEGQKVIARFPSSRLVQVGSVTAVLPPRLSRVQTKKCSTSHKMSAFNLI